MKNNFKLLTLSASLLAAGMALSPQAQANVYAYSNNNLLDGFFISNNTANTFGLPGNSVSDSAGLTGFAPVAFTDVGTGLRDAAPANINIALANNVWAPQGQLASPYARGDAAITQEQFGTLAGQGIRAQNVAETNVVYAGAGDAMGKNASGTLYNVLLSVTTPGTATFKFTFDPLLMVAMDALAKPGSFALATLTASLTITDSSGLVAVNWVPDGPTGGGVLGYIGGTEAADPYSLNKTLPLFFSGSATLDDPLGYFEMTTGNLPVGLYNVAASFSELASVNRVPEPASLALLGLGLAGLVFARRRMQV